MEPATAPATRGAAVALLLCATAFLAPALGVPHEEMLQDTLKSIVVVFGTLCAALLFFVQQRNRHAPLQWHAVLWLPLALLAHALGSMAWSHPYLGGVEAVRWFVFALLAWLAMQVFGRERLPWLAAALHGGAVVASLWAAAQFWGDLRWFPQGPNPGATFINRNFFAEFAVSTVPFAFLLVARERRPAVAAALAASAGFVIVALLMTGTRSALIALGLLLAVFALIAWRCRAQLAWSAWPVRWRLAVPGVVAATVLLLGAIPSGNPQILAEGRGATALERAVLRARSIAPEDRSLGLRMTMWRATANLIRHHPLAGVGAGAWENEIPRYQKEGAQVETDYYVHNEYLQLVAEYGVVGWVFLGLLLAYLALAAWRTWRRPAHEDALGRAVLLASLLALLVVSSIGFPWRLAATGALFALVLGALAASDARWDRAAARLAADGGSAGSDARAAGSNARAAGSDARAAAGNVRPGAGYGPGAGEVRPGARLARELPWSPRIARAAAATTLGGLALALVVADRAVESERKIVQALQLALAITASGEPDHPAWRESRRELLRLAREGIAINPHYRKITPLVADELARWGDWANATWIWESVLGSRPNVVAILCNVARGYASMNRPDEARAALERAKRIQPNAPSIHSLEVILLARGGQEARALALARSAVASGLYDYDMVNTLYVLARRAGDWPLATSALQRRMDEWPDTRALGLVQMGVLQFEASGDRSQALATIREGLALAGPRTRGQWLALVPAELRGGLRE